MTDNRPNTTPEPDRSDMSDALARLQQAAQAGLLTDLKFSWERTV